MGSLLPRLTIIEILNHEPSSQQGNCPDFLLKHRKINIIPVDVYEVRGARDILVIVLEHCSKPIKLCTLQLSWLVWIFYDAQVRSPDSFLVDLKARGLKFR